MPTKRYSTEQIVGKLRQAEVEFGTWSQIRLTHRNAGGLCRRGR